ADEGQLRVVVPADGDAGRVDLRVAGVGEAGALLEGPQDGRHVAADRVGGQVIEVAVAAGGEDDGVGGERLDAAGDEVAGHDAPRLAVDDDEVEHLGPREHLDVAEADLAAERLVGAEQQLLAGLPGEGEGSGDEGAAEGAVGGQAAIFAGERDALGDALVDDVDADLGQPVDVGLARAVITPLDGVVEEAVNAVAVVLVILGGVDAALGRDAVGAPRPVLVAEANYLV